LSEVREVVDIGCVDKSATINRSKGHKHRIGCEYGALSGLLDPAKQ
jgi:hypothetical protein